MTATDVRPVPPARDAVTDAEAAQILEEAVTALRARRASGEVIY